MLIPVEDVMGAAEIGELLGVSRQRVQQLVSRADFPAPVKVLAMGKIWLADDVKAWDRARQQALSGGEEPPAKPAKKTARKAPGRGRRKPGHGSSTTSA